MTSTCDKADYDSNDHAHHDSQRRVPNKSKGVQGIQYCFTGAEKTRQKRAV